MPGKLRKNAWRLENKGVSSYVALNQCFFGL